MAFRKELGDAMHAGQRESATMICRPATPKRRQGRPFCCGARPRACAIGVAIVLRVHFDASVNDAMSALGRDKSGVGREEVVLEEGAREVE